MAVFTRTTKNLILKIDEFFDNIDLGLLVFREGVKAYLEKDMETFNRHIQKVELLESNADKLQRSIENEMITHSILPQHRGEVSSLIDVLDEIIDTIKSSLNEFSIELPDIPASLNSQLHKYYGGFCFCRRRTDSCCQGIFQITLYGEGKAPEGLLF